MEGMELAGRVALVTGGASGLGYAVTRALLAAGARVAVTDRGHDMPMEMATATPEMRDFGYTMVRADLTDEASAANAVRDVARMHDRLDILCNIVGGYAGGQTIAETDLRLWQQQLDLNLLTAFLTCRAAVPHMAEHRWGRIINISSRAAVLAPAGLGAYAVSKAAVLTLTEVLANETRDQGITVNALLPSVIDTPANRRNAPEADFDRWVKPEEIGAVIRFLAGEGGAIISGAALPVYGRA